MSESNFNKTMKDIKQSKWTRFENKVRFLIILICITCILYMGAFKWLEIEILNVSPVYPHQTLKIAPQNRLIKEAEAKAIDPSKLNTEDYIAYKFGKDAKVALAVAKCESGLNEYAVNKNTDGSWDFGTWQLNEKWQLKPRKLTRADAFNSHKSTDVAYQIYSEQKGFNAWSCYKSKAYLKLL